MSSIGLKTLLLHFVPIGLHMHVTKALTHCPSHKPQNTWMTVAPLGSKSDSCLQNFFAP